MSRRIPIIKKGKEYVPYYVIADDEDYEFLSTFKWFFAQRGRNIYAQRNVGGRHKIKSGSTLMHTLLTGFTRTDHVNGIGLDNRRENLRPCNQSQNGGNSQKTKRNTVSSYKGVWFDPSRDKWESKIAFNRKTIHLGRFDSEEKAARAYDDKAQELFGEFARLNFPPTI